MKLIIDIPDEEYTTLSELSEKEKVNELSYYERVIANGNPYEDRPKGKWLHKHMKEDYTLVGTCSICRERTRIGNFCRICGADMRGSTE